MREGALKPVLMAVGFCGGAYVLGLFMAMGASSAGGLVNLHLYLDAPATSANPSGYSADCQRVEWDL